VLCALSSRIPLAPTAPPPPPPPPPSAARGAQARRPATSDSYDPTSTQQAAGSADTGSSSRRRRQRQRQRKGGGGGVERGTKRGDLPDKLIKTGKQPAIKKRKPATSSGLAPALLSLPLSSSSATKFSGPAAQNPCWAGLRRRRQKAEPAGRSGTTPSFRGGGV
jgi:hypothetical protein